MIKEVENNNTVSNLSKKTSLEALQFFPINTFQIGSCLFWSTALAYLTDLKFDEQAFTQSEYDLQFHLACVALFGEVEDAEEKRLKKLVEQFHVTHDLTFIYRSDFVQALIFLFRQRVVGYIDQHRGIFQRSIPMDFDSYLCSMRIATKFAGSIEIEAMTAFLGCFIDVVDINTGLTFLYPSFINSSDREKISLIQVLTRSIQLFSDQNKQYYYFGPKKKKAELYSNLIPVKIVEDKLGDKKNSSNLKENLSLLSRIDVPGDGNCLFWAAALAYLISMGSEKFTKACDVLFGLFSDDLEDIKEEVNNFNSQSLQKIIENITFANLVRINFRRQVIRYMSLHRNEFEFEANDIDNYLERMLVPGTWGGWQEVKAISSLLKCEIILFPSWDLEMKNPLKTGSGFPVLYLFHESDHYYFGLLKKEIKTHENNFKCSSDLKLSSILAKRYIPRKKLRTSKTAFLSKSLKQSLFNDLVEGISIGLFLETSLWILASTPFFKFFIFERNSKFYNALNFSTFIEFPYLYFQNYQEFLLKSTEFDKLLNNFFDKERIFVWGIVLGMVGGLIKYFINTEDAEKFLITMGIFMSILPSDYLHENLEVAQLLVRCMLMLFLSLNGLLSIIDFSLPYVKKTSDSASFSIKNLSNKISYFFSKKEAENKAMDSEISLQPGTRASL